MAATSLSIRCPNFKSNLLSHIIYTRKCVRSNYYSLEIYSLFIFTSVYCHRERGYITVTLYFLIFLLSSGWKFSRLTGKGMYHSNILIQIQSDGVCMYVSVLAFLLIGANKWKLFRHKTYISRYITYAYVTDRRHSLCSNIVD